MARIRNGNGHPTTGSLSALLPSSVTCIDLCRVGASNTGVRYSSLCRDRREIRLLRVYIDRQRPFQGLNDFDGQLCCTLKTVSLSEKPTYLAVSYSWSDSSGLAPGYSNSIHINGVPTPVKDNLICLFEAICNGENSEWLWVDSLCINQKDTLEKEWQIRLMADIYAQASATIIWLGCGYSGMVDAMHFVGRLTERKLMRALDSIEESCSAAAKYDVDETIPSNIGEEFNTVSEEEEFQHVSHKEWVSRDSPRFIDLVSLKLLLSHSWWGRRWVVQEAFLSQMPIVALSPSMRPLVLSERRARDRHAQIKFEAIATNMDSFAKLAVWHERYISRNPGAHEFIKSLFLDCPFYPLLKNWQNFRSGGAALYRAPLPKWLALTRGFKQSLPRDAIFSLLSLLSAYDQLMIHPDYTATDEIVFQSLFIHMFQTYGFLHIDRFLPCLPKDLRLPSWCPNSVSRSLGANTFPITISGHENLFKAGGEGPRRLHFTYSDTLQRTPSNHPEKLKSSFGRGVNVVVRGFKFDEIAATLGTGLCSGYSLEPGLGSLQERVKAAVQSWRRRLFGLHELPYGSQAARVEALVLTLLGGRIGSNTKEEWVGQFQDWTRREANSESAKSFYAGIRSRCLNRSLVITTKGFIGLAPLACTAGDSVAVFLGSSTPFLLRRVDKPSHYTLLGDCYIHGIMHGEAVPEGVVKDITIS